MSSIRHAVVVALVLLLAACSSRVTPENYEKLQPGMTKAQVHAILGKPDLVTGDDIGGVLSLTKEVWKASKQSITVTFGNDALALKSLDGPAGPQQ
ncbi:MAG: hypothetical protein NVS9B10_16450 [Nevskia sp.]